MVLGRASGQSTVGCLRPSSKNQGLKGVGQRIGPFQKKKNHPRPKVAEDGDFRDRRSHSYDTLSNEKTYKLLHFCPFFSFCYNK